ncbi:unnamed protein product [Paramecium sonneborni]|uniref:Uncharacterized protein n=1 Tax=Paramecium sonneborni TaxID=65129 RepID=A0A8S1RDF7_9CILI|nr:unnamed protein product [Paramecium sonneborni]
MERKNKAYGKQFMTIQNFNFNINQQWRSLIQLEWKKRGVLEKIIQINRTVQQFQQKQSQIFVVLEEQYNDGKKQDQWNYVWIEPLNRNNYVVGIITLKSKNKVNGRLQTKNLQKISNLFILDFIVVVLNKVSGIFILEEIKKQAQKDCLKLYIQIFSGGGLYENGAKIQKWSNNFSEFTQIIFKKLQNFSLWKLQLGYKIKRMVIRIDQESFQGQNKYCNLSQQFIRPGGNQNNYGQKVENWIELHEDYHEQVLNFQNLKLIKKWITKYRYIENDQFEILQLLILINNLEDEVNMIQMDQNKVSGMIQLSIFFFLNGNYSVNRLQGQFKMQYWGTLESNSEFENQQDKDLYKKGRKRDISQKQGIILVRSVKFDLKVIMRKIQKKENEKYYFEIQKLKFLLNVLYNTLNLQEEVFFKKGTKINQWIDVINQCTSRERSREQQQQSKINTISKEKGMISGVNLQQRIQKFDNEYKRNHEDDKKVTNWVSLYHNTQQPNFMKRSVIKK